ncbi:unnamed protein product [Spirodela intermedia]|uniref:GATA-type domain-containing protein n=1 Tax=Spirodela intermedia TaxID=51605 RepID=A0A7I8J8K6_SPIIN|nr:unnamed protein product [Spirodela intermedia]CAA6666507.1 unnamed protein product [Spirodela intermedia]
MAGVRGGGAGVAVEQGGLSDLETFDVYAYRKPSSPAPPPALAAAEGGSKRPSPVSVLAKGFLPAASPFLQRTPRRARSQGQQRRRRVLPVFPSSRSSPGEEKRRCWHCGAGETPQWRAGPHGPKTLCNACGVRYKSGRLVPEYRPASSPTFSSALHSNSHRKIMEMRRRKEGQAHSAAGGGGAASTTANKKKKKKRKRKGLRLL